MRAKGSNPCEIVLLITKKYQEVSRRESAFDITEKSSQAIPQTGKEKIEKLLLSHDAMYFWW